MTDEAFAKALTAMTRTLYNVCYSYLRNGCDREDAVQEALYRAWEKRSQLRDERYLSTWVIRILINECRNIQRKSRDTEELADIPVPPGADMKLHDAILKLPEKLRLPIVLYHMEGYRVKEIATILRIPQGTVKTRLAAGRRELKHKLSEEGFAIC